MDDGEYDHDATLAAQIAAQEEAQASMMAGGLVGIGRRSGRDRAKRKGRRRGGADDDDDEISGASDYIPDDEEEPGSETSGAVAEDDSDEDFGGTKKKSSRFGKKRGPYKKRGTKVEKPPSRREANAIDYSLLTPEEAAELPSHVRAKMRKSYQVGMPHLFELSKTPLQPVPAPTRYAPFIIEQHLCHDAQASEPVWASQSTRPVPLKCSRTGKWFIVPLAYAIELEQQREQKLKEFDSNFKPTIPMPAPRNHNSNSSESKEDKESQMVDEGQSLERDIVSVTITPIAVDELAAMIQSKRESSMTDTTDNKVSGEDDEWFGVDLVTVTIDVLEGSDEDHADLQAKLNEISRNRGRGKGRGRGRRGRPPKSSYLIAAPPTEIIQVSEQVEDEEAMILWRLQAEVERSTRREMLKDEINKWDSASLNDAIPIATPTTDPTTNQPSSSSSSSSSPPLATTVARAVAFADVLSLSAPALGLYHSDSNVKKERAMDDSFFIDNAGVDITAGFDESEIEMGTVVTAHHLMTSEPWNYPRLGITPFTAQTYHSLYHDPEWTLFETVALLDFATRHNVDQWALVVADPILSVRHTPRTCEARLQAVLALAAFYGREHQSAFLKTASPQNLDLPRAIRAVQPGCDRVFEQRWGRNGAPTVAASILASNANLSGFGNVDDIATKKSNPTPGSAVSSALTATPTKEKKTPSANEGTTMTTRTGGLSTRSSRGDGVTSALSSSTTSTSAKEATNAKEGTFVSSLGRQSGRLASKGVRSYADLEKSDDSDFYATDDESDKPKRKAGKSAGGQGEGEEGPEAADGGGEGYYEEYEEAGPIHKIDRVLAVRNKKQRLHFKWDGQPLDEAKMEVAYRLCKQEAVLAKAEERQAEAASLQYMRDLVAEMFEPGDDYTIGGEYPEIAIEFEQEPNSEASDVDEMIFEKTEAEQEAYWQRREDNRLRRQAEKQKKRTEERAIKEREEKEQREKEMEVKAKERRVVVTIMLERAKELGIEVDNEGKPVDPEAAEAAGYKYYEDVDEVGPVGADLKDVTEQKPSLSAAIGDSTGLVKTEVAVTAPSSLLSSPSSTSSSSSASSSSSSAMSDADVKPLKPSPPSSLQSPLTQPRDTPGSPKRFSQLHTIDLGSPKLSSQSSHPSMLPSSHSDSSSSSSSSSTSSSSSSSSTTSSSARSLVDWSTVPLPSSLTEHPFILRDPPVINVHQFLVKDAAQSYIRLRWLTEVQMRRRYGLRSTADRVKRFLAHREEIESTNLDRYGGAHFDPRFVEVDRVLALQTYVTDEETIRENGHTIESVKGTVIPPNTPFLIHEDGNVELLPIGTQIPLPKGTKPHGAIEEAPEPFPRVACQTLLVKWAGLGYSQATWEYYVDVHDEMKVAQYRRVARMPTTTQLQEKKYFTEEQQRVRKMRQSRWYVESPTFKTGHTLRDYQIQGINWMIDGYMSNRNGILADEMGLGKTVQCVAFLEHLRREEGVRGPFLIVAPLSTLTHWKREAESWTDMNVLLYHDATGGAQGREILRQHEFYYKGTNIVKFNILITSYEMLLADLPDLESIKWKYLIVDEGHRLKNKTARLMEAFDQLKIPRRLLLTGTPIQNNTTELWTLLNFVEPDQFHSLRDFHQKFKSLEESSQVLQLQKAISRYILRRMKETVEKSIPPKEETIIDVELTVLQKKYYRAIYERNAKFLRIGLTTNNMPKLINIETELRKVCNHPWLVAGTEEKEVPLGVSDDEYFKSTIQASGKLVLLDKLLPKLKEEGHRVLIFSQMVMLLDILEQYLKYRQFKYERLDGSITGDNREAAIDRFTRPDSDRFVFLLSTRAGGVGLNLTTADTVIIFDSDWNPQMDVQAQARAHRIGQTKAVSVYRLVTRNTYESQMFARASKKLGLDHAVLRKLEADKRDDNDMEEDERKDIDKVLKLGAYALVNEDDDEQRRSFFESDIEQILKKNTHVISNKPRPSDKNVNSNPTSGAGALDLSSGGMDLNGQLPDDDSVSHLLEGKKTQGNSITGLVFSKQYFSSEGSAESKLDINDANFWSRVLGKGSEDFRLQADSLLSRLTDGSALKSTQSKTEFFDDLKKGATQALRRKQEGEDLGDEDEWISLLLTFCSISSFPQHERDEANQWLRDFESRTRRARLETEAALKKRGAKGAMRANGSGRPRKGKDEDEYGVRKQTRRRRVPKVVDDDTPISSMIERRGKKKETALAASAIYLDDDFDADEGSSVTGRRKKSSGRGGDDDEAEESMGDDGNESNESDLSGDEDDELLGWDSREEYDEDDEEIEDDVSDVAADDSDDDVKRRRRRRGANDEDDKVGVRNCMEGRPLQSLRSPEELYSTVRRGGRGGLPQYNNYLCSVCFCPGELVPCDGPCHRQFHLECIPRNVVPASVLGRVRGDIARAHVQQREDDAASVTVQVKNKRVTQALPPIETHLFSNPLLPPVSVLGMFDDCDQILDSYSKLRKSEPPKNMDDEVDDNERALAEGSKDEVVDDPAIAAAVAEAVAVAPPTESDGDVPILKTEQGVVLVDNAGLRQLRAQRKADQRGIRLLPTPSSIAAQRDVATVNVHDRIDDALPDLTKPDQPWMCVDCRACRWRCYCCTLPAILNFDEASDVETIATYAAALANMAGKGEGAMDEASHAEGKDDKDKDSADLLTLLSGAVLKGRVRKAREQREREEADERLRGHLQQLVAAFNKDPRLAGLFLTREFADTSASTGRKTGSEAHLMRILELARENAKQRHSLDYGIASMESHAGCNALGFVAIDKPNSSSSTSSSSSSSSSSTPTESTAMIDSDMSSSTSTSSSSSGLTIPPVISRFCNGASCGRLAHIDCVLNVASSRFSIHRPHNFGTSKDKDSKEGGDKKDEDKKDESNPASHTSHLNPVAQAVSWGSYKCSAHVCALCVAAGVDGEAAEEEDGGDEGDNKQSRTDKDKKDKKAKRNSREFQLITCVMCPTSYHIKCIPVRGCVRLTRKSMFCKACTGVALRSEMGRRSIELSEQAVPHRWLRPRFDVKAQKNAFTQGAKKARAEQREAAKKKREEMKMKKVEEREEKKAARLREQSEKKERGRGRRKDEIGEDGEIIRRIRKSPDDDDEEDDDDLTDSEDDEGKRPAKRQRRMTAKVLNMRADDDDLDDEELQRAILDSTSAATAGSSAASKTPKKRLKPANYRKWSWREVYMPMYIKDKTKIPVAVDGVVRKKVVFYLHDDDAQNTVDSSKIPEPITKEAVNDVPVKHVANFARACATAMKVHEGTMTEAEADADDLAHGYDKDAPAGKKSRRKKDGKEGEARSSAGKKAARSSDGADDDDFGDDDDDDEATSDDDAVISRKSSSKGKKSSSSSSSSSSLDAMNDEM